MKLKINSQTSLDDAHRFLDEYWSKHKHVTLTIERRQRTGKQNNSLHKYFELLADELNEKGLDMRKVLKPEIDIPWNKDTIKKYIWSKIQKIMFNTESTTKLKTNEVSQVYDVIHRSMVDKHDVFVMFPHDENKEEL